MEKQTIYKEHARYYDLLYSWKAYEREADKIKQLIDRHKRSPGNDLLEVGCGTGRHSNHLKKDFSIVATDLNEGMLRIARKNCGKVIFKRADMITLNLGRTFDVVLCLFSSIGYVKTYENLQKTIHNFGRHLKAGGVLIIEPWFTKSKFRVGAPSLSAYNGDGVKIARLSVTEVRGDVSVIDMHYLVAGEDKTVRYFVDRHELGMFERTKTLEFLRQAGLKATFRADGLMKDRGLFIGVKK